MFTSRHRSGSSLEIMNLTPKPVAYSVATCVFLAVLVGGTARADIIYSGAVDLSVSVGSGYSGTPPYELDLTGSLTGPLSSTSTLLSFYNYVGQGITFFGVTPGTNAAVAWDGADPLALSSGASISSSDSFSTPNSQVQMATYSSSYGISQGHWVNATDKYLGVQFTAGGSTYYGWVELSTQASTNSMTILGYAYETVAGQAINAGATMDAAVPEPSSLALMLLAMGSTGAGVLLRGRKRAKAAPSV